MSECVYQLLLCFCFICIACIFQGMAVVTLAFPCPFVLLYFVFCIFFVVVCSKALLFLLHLGNMGTRTAFFIFPL